MSETPTLAGPRTQARVSASRPEPGDRPVRAAGSGPRHGQVRARWGPRRAWVPRLQPRLPLPQTCACHSPPNRLQKPERRARTPALLAALALASLWGAFWGAAGGGLGQRERGFHFFTRQGPQPRRLLRQGTSQWTLRKGDRDKRFWKGLNLESAVRPGLGSTHALDGSPPARSLCALRATRPHRSEPAGRRLPSSARVALCDSRGGRPFSTQGLSTPGLSERLVLGSTLGSQEP